MNVSRRRAISTPGSATGKLRYGLYKAAYDQIKSAITHGFHLEAITLVESLISDRLESRLSFLKQADFSFKTLGTLITETGKIETDPELKSLVTQRLNKWRRDRNAAIHEMVKLAAGEAATWSERAGHLHAIAEEGLVTLRAIDKRYRELRKLNI